MSKRKKNSDDQMPTTPMTGSSESLLDQIKNNYSSLVLGLLVILVGASLLSRYSGQQNKMQLEKKVQEQKKQEAVAKMNTSHVVAKGDTLWSIAESRTGSGYNWVDYAKENKLTNPDRLEVGTKLTIPSVITPRPATTGEVVKTMTQQVTMKQDTYTVVKGDSLWSISVRAYGDGYMWSQLAKANQLINPDLIQPGQKLKIPR